MDIREKKLFDKYNPQEDVVRCPYGRAPFREKLDYYVFAALNLYGAIRVEELVELFNHHYKEELSVEELYILLLPLIRKQRDYAFYKDYLVNYQYVDNLSWVDNLLSLQEGKEFYKPSLEELLKYFNDYYSDNPYVKKLEKFLEDSFDGLVALIVTDKIKELADYGGVNPQNLSEIAEEFDLVFPSQKSFEKFVDLVFKLNNNNRSWSNRGNTPIEASEQAIKKLPKEPRFKEARRIKVGRNQPCPCGSGKKYKNCCAFYANSDSAYLSLEEYMLFFRLWYGLLKFVNDMEGLVRVGPDQDFPQDLDDQSIYEIGQALWDKPDYIDNFIEEYEDILSKEDKHILISWKNLHRKTSFLVMAYRANYAEILPVDRELEPRLLGLKGLSLPIANLAGLILPVHMEGTLLPFLGHIIFDGNLAAYPIEFGEGMKKILKESHEEAKKKEVITNLEEEGWLYL